MMPSFIRSYIFLQDQLDLQDKHLNVATVVTFGGLKDSPFSIVFGNEFVGQGGSPGAGDVGGQGTRIPLTFQDGLEERPCGFDLVGAGKESGIAQGRIEQESFIGFGRVFAEGV